MALAFKEWSFIVDALGKGYQSIILRKGGISEEEGEFTLKGKKFLLFPTLYHQAKEHIKPEWLQRLDGTRFHPGQETVKIEYFAEVIEKRIVKDWDTLQRFEKEHAWTEEIVKERFNRWEKSVHLLLVQIYKLNNPFELELKPEYEGCKSWIQLDINDNFEGQAVINEKIKGTYFK